MRVATKAATKWHYNIQADNVGACIYSTETKASNELPSTANTKRIPRLPKLPRKILQMPLILLSYARLHNV